MKAKQFTNEMQINLYEKARPKYIKDIFTKIMGSVNKKNFLLDIACGNGQLLFPMCDKFDLSVGIDVSPEQIKKAKERVLREERKNIFFYANDVYDLGFCLDNEKYFKENKIDYKNKFDLVVIGQAFHWFDEEKLLKFIKNELLHPDGVLAITGYKKQHFKEGEKLFPFYDKLIKELTPYFECDVKYNDSGYERSFPIFKNHFKNFEVDHYTEEMKFSIENVLDLAKSASAYVNFEKTNNEREENNKIGNPLNDLIRGYKSLGLSEIDEVDFCNFYFLLLMHN